MMKILVKEVTSNNIMKIIEEKIYEMFADERLKIREFENYFNSIKEKDIIDYSILQALADWLPELSKTDN